jgi:hypothetical protein
MSAGLRAPLLRHGCACLSQLFPHIRTVLPPAAAKGPIMSNRQLYKSDAVFRPALAPLVISIGGLCTGVAVGEKNGFRFIAAHPRFNLLDGSYFRRLDDLRAAAGRLAKAGQAPAGRAE